MLCELFIFDCGGMCKLAGYFTNSFELYIFRALKHWYVLWFASNNATRVILTLRAFRTLRRSQRLKRSLRSRLIDGSQPEHPRCLHRGCSGLPKFLLFAVILPSGSFERMRSQELKCSLARI